MMGKLGRKLPGFAVAQKEDKDIGARDRNAERYRSWALQEKMRRGSFLETG